MVAQHPEPGAEAEGDAMTPRPVAATCAHYGVSTRNPFLAVDRRSGCDAALCAKCQHRVETGVRPATARYELKEPHSEQR